MGEPGTKEVLNLEDLEASGGIRTGRRHVLSILVENKPGVLARIAGLFARRGFNIDSLAVGPTDDESMSRITLTVDGAAHPIDQVTKQLHKLVHVIKIRDLGPDERVARELALFKISCQDGESRAQVMQFTDIFRGSVVDVSKRSVTVEVTGTDDKVEAFEEMVRPFGLIEMVRTGEVAVARGRGAT
ncbi:MAG TPA: acetolactate synthase small subunit [Thermoleophilaceae bacterium]|jgi:acetolactate synthase-1/3 small subunit|nr:acetolactate synthase small subunit [Thermoleophilaceae bacterium]